MSRVRVLCFAVSADGFAAGPRQSLEQPLGVGGMELMEWFFNTRTWRQSQGMAGGESGTDHALAAQGFDNIGAWIIGRNMFGPVRGPWPDESWRGWWGDEPPYHTPVFVLTHHPRAALSMAGGTQFRFAGGDIRAVLDAALEAARGADVRIGGGPATVRQFLAARLVDDLHLVVRPVLLGGGEPLWQGMNLRDLGYECTRTVAGERATHLFLSRRD